MCQSQWYVAENCYVGPADLFHTPEGKGTTLWKTLS